MSLCQACQLGKSYKLPFANSSTVYNKLFEFIEADLWGPAPIVSLGYSFYIAFIDAHSRFVWISLLKHKSEALHTFKEFKAKVEI